MVAAILLGALAAIVVQAPSFLVLIRLYRKCESKEAVGNVKILWLVYLAGCALTMLYSWQFSLFL